MNKALVDKIVEAVLYEGYVLYPYRPSVKNRQRWTFGGVYPQAYAEANRANPGSDAYEMQAQVLVRGGESAVVRAQVRFLHLASRDVWRTDGPARTAPTVRTARTARTDRSAEVAAADGGTRVESMCVDGRVYQSWQEAVEREVGPDPVAVERLAGPPALTEFSFPAGLEWEPLRERDGRTVGRIVRERHQVEGLVEMSARRVEGLNGVNGLDGLRGAFRLTVRVENRTPLAPDQASRRDDALLRAFASTHAVLHVEGGAFVSPTDPPEYLREAAAECRNLGCWPVLVGEPGQTDTLLCSPVILYDYPQVAPESPGDLFDGTEIDEILSLRIQALTDEEKRHAAATDDRVARLLARTDALAREQLAGLHGALRGLRAVPPAIPPGVPAAPPGGGTA